MSCQNKITKPVKNPTLKTCARIFWCGMRLCPFLDLEGVPGCSTMQMEINLHCRHSHFSGNWNCHTGPRTCARIFWCGMGLPLFLDLVAWRSKMQILIKLALLTLPSFSGKWNFQTTVAVPACARIFWCGMRRRLFLDLDGLVLKMQLGINSCCQCSLCFR